MVNEIWINLPVNDVARSKEFFRQIGFSFNEERCNGNDSACMVVGRNGIVVMLFAASLFKGFAANELADTSRGTEVLLSFDGESREAVDEMAKKVAAAGGNVFSPPAENQGWMYGFGFADPDGHRWNQLYMDMSKMSQ